MKYFRIGLPDDIITIMRAQKLWEKPDEAHDVEIVDLWLESQFVEAEYEGIISTEETVQPGRNWLPFGKWWELNLCSSCESYNICKYKEALENSGILILVCPHYNKSEEGKPNCECTE